MALAAAVLTGWYLWASVQIAWYLALFAGLAFGMVAERLFRGPLRFVVTFSRWVLRLAIVLGAIALLRHLVSGG